MWVRKLVKRGDTLHVGVPIECVRALKLERGDHMLVVQYDAREIRITKFNPAQVSDRARAELEPLPIIQHD